MFHPITTAAAAATTTIAILAALTAPSLALALSIPPNPGPNLAIDYSTLRCPDAAADNNATTLPTPTYGTKGGVFSVCASAVVAAAPRRVYDALLDFRSYGQWNTFVVDAAVPADVPSTPAGVHVGMRMTLTTRGVLAAPGLNTTSSEIITVLDDGDASGSGSGYLLAAWRYDDGLGGAGSRAEHPTVLVGLGDGTTRMLSYETYYEGLFTGAIALLKDRLQERFETQAADLKAYVEGMGS